MNNVFSKAGTEALISRINRLSPDTRPQWGKMNAGQMLAHCSVAYEMAFGEGNHKKPSPIVRMLLKAFLKSTVVGDKPYRKNSKTAPAFLIADEKNFEQEKARLIGYLNKTQQLGESHFEGKESLSFGKMTKEEWNAMFYKHLDYHLNQFGV